MPLSKDQVIAAALEVVDDEGWPALSMRRLAQELDVWPMAIYRHFQDKDELVGAVQDAAVTAVGLPVAEGPWRARISRLLNDARPALRRSAGSSVAEAMFTPGGLRLAEAGLAILADAGFAPSEAARAWHGLFGYTLAFGGGAPGRDGRARARTAIAAVDEDEHPHVVAAAPELAEAGRETAGFDYGLERLLDGLEASLHH